MKLINIYKEFIKECNGNLRDVCNLFGGFWFYMCICKCEELIDVLGFGN